MPKLTLILACSFLAAGNPLAAWGQLGHRMAATAALADLPSAVAAWYLGQEAVLPEHANDPDQWKQSDPLEGPRHYLDCEFYGGPGDVPRDQDAARAKVGPDVFQKSGQVPWVVLARVDHLARAFGAGDAAQVAFESAILCHYVADLCVPLHTTSNHNGDETGQHGVHQRWESKLLERIVDQQGWRPEVRVASLGQDPSHAPWAWLQTSFEHVPDLLADDLTAQQADQGGRESLGPRYWETFQRLEEPLVKEQLALAAQRTAQMITLAWTRAGSPPIQMPGRR